MIQIIKRGGIPIARCTECKREWYAAENVKHTHEEQTTMSTCDDRTCNGQCIHYRCENRTGRPREGGPDAGRAVCTCPPAMRNATCELHGAIVREPEIRAIVDPTTTAIENIAKERDRLRALVNTHADRILADAGRIERLETRAKLETARANGAEEREVTWKRTANEERRAHEHYQGEAIAMRDSRDAVIKRFADLASAAFGPFASSATRTPESDATIIEIGINKLRDDHDKRQAEIANLSTALNKEREEHGALVDALAREASEAFGPLPAQLPYTNLVTIKDGIAKLRSERAGVAAATERAQLRDRIHVISKQRDDLERQGKVTQERLEQFLGACADQTVQIMELRGALREVKPDHPLFGGKIPDAQTGG